MELISEDGSRFHAHRLVLCAQSPVFKSMLDSELWVESRNKEVGYLLLIALPLSMATRILNTVYSVCMFETIVHPYIYTLAHAHMQCIH